MSHALLLRPSNHIYAAAALSQSKVHDADRRSPERAKQQTENRKITKLK